MEGFPKFPTLSDRLKTNTRALLPPAVSVAQAGYADSFCDRLEKQIKKAEDGLKKGEQIGLYYHLAGETVSVREISWHNPHLVIFYGNDQHGNPVEVLAHVESVQLLLRVEGVGSTSAPARRIGFRAGEESEEASSEPTE